MFGYIILKVQDYIVASINSCIFFLYASQLLSNLYDTLQDHKENPNGYFHCNSNDIQNYLLKDWLDSILCTKLLGYDAPTMTLYLLWK